MPKRLILSVVSSQRDALGANYTHTFTEGVASIGRDETSDWQLPDTAVSRRHATVRLLNGTFFLEDFSTNGTFVGGADASNRLVKNQPRPLRTGDKILIGDYEIVAALEEAAVEASEERAPVRRQEATAVEPPEAPSPKTAGPSPMQPPSEEGVMPGASPPPEAPVAKAAGETDPLKLLGVTPPKTPSSSSMGAGARPRDEVPAGSGLEESMPPLSSVPPAPQVPPAPRVQPTPSGGSQIPADWWKQPAEPPPAPQEPPETPASLAPPTPPNQPSTLGAAAEDDVLVRELVAGLMSVLNARAEIKRRFRVSMTVIQAKENNPLKFAVDADEAMAKLFGSVSSGYLGPRDAFEEAFRDLKAHQLAMLAGMREAFNKMLKQFDPHRLEVRFEKTVGKGKLPFMRDRHWELYKELYDELTADAEDSFHQLFGNAFAMAYEREMQKLVQSLKRGE